MGIIAGMWILPLRGGDIKQKPHLAADISKICGLARHAFRLEFRSPAHHMSLAVPGAQEQSTDEL
jgi:hypothetical protein